MINLKSHSGILIGKFNIINWRAIFIDKKDITVCLPDFSCISLYDMTIEKFNSFNYIGIDGDVIGEISGLFLVCKKCKGKGSIDWISNVVGQPHTYQVYKNYTRDNTKSVTVINESRFYSKPLLENKTEDYCEECRGSGLYNASLYKTCGYKEITFKKS